MFQDCLWCFVCCDHSQQRSGVANKPTNCSYYICLVLKGNARKEYVVLGLRATGMMHSSLASNSSLDHDQFNEIRWKLRRHLAPPSSVVKCSW